MIVVLLLALAGLQFQPALANADTPYHVDIPRDETNILTGMCAFDITDHVYGSWRVNFWTGASGEITHAIWLWGNLKETYSANGKSVDVRMLSATPTDYIYGTDQNFTYVTMVGTNSLVTIPGYGKVSGGGGQIQLRWTFTSDWDIVGYTIEKQVGNIIENWGPICDYLGS